MNITKQSAIVDSSCSCTQIFNLSPKLKFTFADVFRFDSKYFVLFQNTNFQCCIVNLSTKKQILTFCCDEVVSVQMHSESLFVFCRTMVQQINLVTRRRRLLLKVDQLCDNGFYANLFVENMGQVEFLVLASLESILLYDLQKKTLHTRRMENGSQRQRIEQCCFGREKLFLQIVNEFYTGDDATSI